MAETSHAESGGSARAEAATVVRRVDTAAFEQHVQNLLGSIELATGVRVWASVRVDPDGDAENRARLEIRAVTAAGDVTASRVVTLPTDARKAIADAVSDAEPGLRDELKRSIARTLAAAALNIGQEA